ncbi:hypothetical protein P4S64_23120 [Vibrio sp. M60_M31a]
MTTAVDRLQENITNTIDALIESDQNYIVIYQTMTMVLKSSSVN